MDNLSPQVRKRTMAAVKASATGPERIVADVMQRLRFKFETNCRDIPGCPDLLSRRRRKAIFVHGCFWHLHTCAAGRSTPKTNAIYWRIKRARNQARDAITRRTLRRAGWAVLTIWECQLHDLARVTSRVRAFMRDKMQQQ